MNKRASRGHHFNAMSLVHASSSCSKNIGFTGYKIALLLLENVFEAGAFFLFCFVLLNNAFDVYPIY